MLTVKFLCYVSVLVLVHDVFESLFGPDGVEKLFQNIEKNDLKKYLDFKNNVILLKKSSLIIADFVTGELFI